jgi:type IV secretory pathway VirB2 component (pilin)
MYPVLNSLLAASNSTGLDVEPSQTGDLPGEQTLTTLASGVGHWALLAAIVGVIVGGVMWAFGHVTHIANAGQRVSTVSSLGRVQKWYRLES